MSRDFIEASLAMSAAREMYCPECMGSHVGYHARTRFNAEGKSPLKAKCVRSF